MGDWRLDPPDNYAPQWPALPLIDPPDVGTLRDETFGPDGRVWLVGDRGIAVYDPTKDKQP